MKTVAGTSETMPTLMSWLRSMTSSLTEVYASRLCFQAKCA